MSEAFKALKELRRDEAAERRKASAEIHHAASRLAQEHGLMLLRRTESHYQLRHLKGGWMVHLYPGNQRIVSDRKGQSAPYLSVPNPWTVEDVVKAAVEKMESESR